MPLRLACGVLGRSHRAGALAWSRPAAVLHAAPHAAGPRHFDPGPHNPGGRDVGAEPDVASDDGLAVLATFRARAALGLAGRCRLGAVAPLHPCALAGRAPAGPL